MPLLQYAFVALLTCVLVAAVISFALMGLGKVRRARRLARRAHERGRRFFPGDPFDVPRRYAAFAVIASGHSPRANNVTDGRIAGTPVRAFDFRCEIGHGTRRTTRQYSVAVAETALDLPPLLMWNEADAQLAPLAARGAGGRLGAWSYRGRADLAAALAEPCRALADRGASIELRGAVVIVSAPARPRAGGYMVEPDDLAGPLAALDHAVSLPPGATRGA